MCTEVSDVYGVVSSRAEQIGNAGERKDPPEEATLRGIIAKLEDPSTDLVRRDSLFKKLELSDDDVATVDQVVQTVLDNKMIMQRPVVVTADTAIIGRPKERVRELLGG